MLCHDPVYWQIAIFTYLDIFTCKAPDYFNNISKLCVIFSLLLYFELDKSGYKGKVRMGVSTIFG